MPLISVSAEQLLNIHDISVVAEVSQPLRFKLVSDLHPPKRLDMSVVTDVSQLLKSKLVNDEQLRKREDIWVTAEVLSFSMPLISVSAEQFWNIDVMSVFAEMTKLLKSRLVSEEHP